MKWLLCLVLAGCVADASPGTEPDPCDHTLVNWGAESCLLTTAQGPYAPSLRLVCPQEDGSEWEMRQSVAQDGSSVKTFFRYMPEPGTHSPAHTVCEVRG